MKVYRVNCLLGIVVDGNSFNLQSNSYIAKKHKYDYLLKDRAILAAILNFCVKRKNTYLGNGSRLRRNFRPTGYMQSLLAKLSPKNRFPAIFGGHLCVKRKSAFILETVRVGPFLQNFEPTGYLQSFSA